MSRKISVALLALTFMVLMAGSAVAPVSADTKDQTITITTGPVADKPFVLVEPYVGQSETITFLNSTGVQINVNNSTWPPAAADKDGGAGNDVADAATQGYVFSCVGSADEGTWVFTVTEGANPPIDVTIEVKCQETPIPTMTFWGILILVLLIVGTGIWILTRKRLATTQA
jgi:hypothetical protein